MRKKLLTVIIMMLVSMPGLAQCPGSSISPQRASQLLRQSEVGKALKVLKRIGGPEIECNARLGSLELREVLSTPKGWSILGVRYLIQLRIPVDSTSGEPRRSAIWLQQLQRVRSLHLELRKIEKAAKVARHVRSLGKTEGQYHFGGAGSDCMTVRAKSGRKINMGGTTKTMHPSVRFCGNRGAQRFTVLEKAAGLPAEILALWKRLADVVPDSKVAWVTLNRQDEKGWSAVGGLQPPGSIGTSLFSANSLPSGDWQIHLKN
jgi:hypothetical protein